jgi:hypothetical protein
MQPYFHTLSSESDPAYSLHMLIIHPPLHRNLSLSTPCPLLLVLHSGHSVFLGGLPNTCLFWETHLQPSSARAIATNQLMVLLFRSSNLSSSLNSAIPASKSCNKRIVTLPELRDSTMNKLKRVNVGKYNINLLPTTSTHGKPIKPTEYNDCLAGALVLKEATLTSDFFATKGFQFYTDIASLSIL